MSCHTTLTQLFSLEGKTAVCTGGTGGIGIELCRSLAEAGANIISIQLANDPAGATLSDAVTQTGRRFQVYECNLGDTTALRATFKRLWASGVVPDILLNCAGVNRRAPIEDMKDADIDLILSVNLKATYVAAQEFGTRLLQLKRPGKIINIASITSYIAMYNVSAYASSKGGVLQMTKAFSNEWASKGIQVNCICPGYIQTPLTTQLEDDKEYSSYIIKHTPAGRWGTPEDLRGAVIFLASAASNFVSGSSVIVDGGMLGT